MVEFSTSLFPYFLVLETLDSFAFVSGFFRDIVDKENGVKDGRNDFVIHAFMLNHPIPCVGYLLLEPPPLPTLHPDKAIALGVKPGPLMGKLKAVRRESYKLLEEYGSFT